MLEIKKDKQVYSVGNLIVAPRLPRPWIEAAWERMINERLLDIVFYEATPQKEWYIKQFSAPESKVFGCFEQGLDTDVNFCGWGRVIPFPMGNNLWKGEISTCFFRAYQRRKYTIPFATMMVEWVFDNLVLKSIFGTTPTPNRPMLKFIKALGFTAIEVPCFTTWKGEPTGIFLSWMTKEMWLARGKSPF